MLITYSGKSGDDNEKSVLKITPFWDILQAKWKQFARKIFIAMFFYYAVFLCALTLSVIRPKSLVKSETELGPVIRGCQIYVLACVCFTIINEIVDIVILQKRYFNDEGLFRFVILFRIYF